MFKSVCCCLRYLYTHIKYNICLKLSCRKVVTGDHHCFVIKKKKTFNTGKHLSGISGIATIWCWWNPDLQRLNPFVMECNANPNLRVINPSAGSIGIILGPRDVHLSGIFHCFFRLIQVTGRASSYFDPWAVARHDLAFGSFSGELYPMLPESIAQNGDGPNFAMRSANSGHVQHQRQR